MNFFSNDLAKKLPQANLIVANNVLAHVPNLHDFVAGLKTLLKRDGTITIEFPHLLNLISLNSLILSIMSTSLISHL